MRLDVSSLREAVGQLERSLSYLRSDLAADDPGLREQFRAASIQAFEYVYELATKLARRQLEQSALNPAEVRTLAFMALMRAAADAGLIPNASPWHGFREMRNRTSHTYDVGEAESVIVELPGFLREVRILLQNLEDRNRA